MEDDSTLFDESETNQDAFQYLKDRQLKILKRIEKLSESGELEDAIKLKASQILLNKVMPDITKHEIEMPKSPYELILEQIQKQAIAVSSPIQIESK